MTQQNYMKHSEEKETEKAEQSSVKIAPKKQVQ